MTSTEQEDGPVTEPTADLVPEGTLDPVNRADGRFHCATVPPDGGPEVCLGCGQPWPCPDAPKPTVHVAALGAAPDPADVLGAAAASRVPWWLVADQMGVDRDDVLALLDAEQEPR